MDETKNILYVEDDKTLSFLTSDSLKMRGFEVTVCEDGEKAWEVFQEHEFKICVLDIMLPKMDGFTLAEKIREVNNDVPIIFLTAKTMIEDKINGLKIGGDDYIIKPFSIEELILKIEIFLKRSKKLIAETEKSIDIGEYKLMFHQLLLKSKTKEQRLTVREADILKFFIQNKNILIKREEILKQIWGDDDYFLGRSLDVFISRLRKYFSDDNRIKIENVHGVGFIFKIQD
jgi:DNA-binding response OmpR family regulator